MGKKQKWAIVVILFSIIVYIGCSSTRVLTNADAEWASKKWQPTSLNDLQKGKTLYEAKCGSCHFLFNPQKYNEKQWHAILPDMAKKAHLQQADEDLVLKYLITAGRDTTQKQ